MSTNDEVPEALGHDAPPDEAFAEVEASSSTSPWAEFDLALRLAGPDIQRSGVLAMSDSELMDLAERAVRDQRVGTRGHTERAPNQHPQEHLQPLSAVEFAIAEQLVAGLVVDLEAERLPDEFELP